MRRNDETTKVGGREEGELAPGEVKTVGRMELFRALRKDDRLELSLVGYPETAKYEIAEEKLKAPVEK